MSHRAKVGRTVLVVAIVFFAFLTNSPGPATMFLLSSAAAIALIAFIRRGIRRGKLGEPWKKR